MEPSQQTTARASETIMPSSTNTKNVQENRIWKHLIIKTNWSFIIASSVLLFGLDLLILINSNFSLIDYWNLMIYVFGTFVVFVGLENYLFKKLFSKSSSYFDSGILFLIVARNVIFLLNFIPSIQLVGLLFVRVAGIPWLIIYSIHIYIRFISIRGNSKVK